MVCITSIYPSRLAESSATISLDTMVLSLLTNIKKESPSSGGREIIELMRGSR
jgi:hypothetical protein